jgi:competence protein ComEA
MPDPSVPASRAPLSPTGERPDPSFWGPERPRRARRRPTASFSSSRWDDALDALRSWQFEIRGFVVAIALAALVAGFVWFRVSSGTATDPPRPRDMQAAAPATARDVRQPDRSARGAATASTTPMVVVHVAGAVRQPGVVDLPVGARVIDALEAVGGGLADADLDRLNLAAKVVDGQRVLVPRVGQPVVADDAASAGIDSPAEGGLLNLNTATAAQLEELPGIGPALAEAILTERQRRGGFRNINELRQVRGIGEARFADLRALVTV